MAISITLPHLSTAVIPFNAFFLSARVHGVWVNTGFPRVCAEHLQWQHCLCSPWRRPAWTLLRPGSPSPPSRQGETIRGSAERALGLTLVQEGLQPFFVGNAPAGHAETGEGTTFFHRCQMIAGTVRLVPGGPYSDLRWAAKDELPELVQDQALLDLFQKML